MNQRIKQLSDEIRKLAPEEQAELIEQISDLIEQTPDPAIEQAWVEEAKRRLAEIDRGEVQVLDARAALARHLRK